MSRTAPIPKLGAMTTPTSGLGSSHSATVASLASSKPVVPTTQWMLLSMQNRMLSMTTSGRVKSTTTCAPALARSNSQSPSSTIATSSRSSAALTALTTSVPIRPRAPSTPTEMSGASPEGSGACCWSGTDVLVVTRSGFPADGPDARQARSAGHAAPGPLPDEETDEQTEDVGDQITDGGVATDHALHDLADRGVAGERSGEKGTRHPRPPAAHRQGGEQGRVDDLVHSGRGTGHVGGRREQHRQRHEDDDREDPPR